MVDLQRKLAEKMYQKYKNLMDQDGCFELAEDILWACANNTSYAVSLKEWLNGKTFFHDYEVHDFSLVDLAYRLDPQNPNIPVSILILSLERQEESSYRGLPAVADQMCVCDIALLKGQLCKYAIKEAGNWYFLLKNKTDLQLKKCQMWQVLLLNPHLILPIAYDHPDNTAIVLQDDGSYLIIYEADRKE